MARKKQGEDDQSGQRDQPQQPQWDGPQQGQQPPGYGQQPQQGYGQQPPMNKKDAKSQARAAKAYSKSQRNWFSRHKFLSVLGALIILIIVIVVKAVSSSSGSSDSASSATTPSTCAGKTYPDQQKNDVCADASGNVTVDGKQVTATPFTAKTDPIGGKALCTNVTIRNTTTKSQDYNVFDFKVQTPGGVVATSSATGIGGTLDSGTLIAGAMKTGLVCTDDKGEKGTYVFIYKPSAFNSARGIWQFPV